MWCSSFVCNMQDLGRMTPAEPFSDTLTACSSQVSARKNSTQKFPTHTVETLAEIARHKWLVICREAWLVSSVVSTSSLLQSRSMHHGTDMQVGVPAAKHAQNTTLWARLQVMSIQGNTQLNYGPFSASESACRACRATR